jgi:hypothetical protein
MTVLFPLDTKRGWMDFGNINPPFVSNEWQGDGTALYPDNITPNALFPLHTDTGEGEDLNKCESLTN